MPEPLTSFARHSYESSMFPSSQPARLQLRALSGANPYSQHSVLYGSLEEISPADLVDWTRVTETIRGLGLPAPVEPGPKATFAHRVGCVVDSIWDYLQLNPTSLDRTVAGDNVLVVPLHAEGLVAAIVQLAVRATRGEPADLLEIHFAKLKTRLDRLLPRHAITYIGRECWRRGIPWRRLAWSDKLHQIGEGSRLCRLDLTVTSHTTRHAVGISANKAETGRLLARFGIPVARHIALQDPRDAWRAALEIGLPVVVKPVGSNKGKGVGLNLTTEQAVVDAAKAALRFGKVILVESLIPGETYRVLIANGRIVGAAKKVAPEITGDGRQTILELVAAENRNPHRSVGGKTTVLAAIEVDDEMERCVATRGYTLDSIVPAGEQVLLRFAGMIGRGATAIDVTDEIHPKTAAMLLKSVSLIGLDVAGIDFVSSDITKPYDEVGAAICEVNSRAGTHAHEAADLNTGKSIIGMLLDAMYTAKNSGRIPLVVVLGTETSKLAVTLGERVTGESGLRVAIISAEQVEIGDTPISVKSRTTWEAHQIATEDPTVDFVILKVAPDEMLANGLGVSNADAVVLGGRDGAADQSDLGVQMAIFEKIGARVFKDDDLDSLLSNLRGAGHLE